MNPNKEKLKGTAEEIKGTIKRELGDTIDNEQMEAEGETERLRGQGRRETARASEHLRGVGEEVKGNVKGAVGDLVDDPQLEAEGRAESLKGRARQKAND